jgi:hypothetical protein
MVIWGFKCNSAAVDDSLTQVLSMGLYHVQKNILEVLWAIPLYYHLPNPKLCDLKMSVSLRTKERESNTRHGTRHLQTLLHVQGQISRLRLCLLYLRAFTMGDQHILRFFLVASIYTFRSYYSYHWKFAWHLFPRGSTREKLIKQLFYYSSSFTVYSVVGQDQLQVIVITNKT